jgi:hypothetical protein
MNFSFLSSILGLASNILNLGWKFVVLIGNFVANRTIRKKYKEGHDAVENGDVDKLNDIITGRKK